MSKHSYKLPLGKSTNFRAVLSHILLREPEIIFPFKVISEKSLQYLSQVDASTL